MVDFFGHVMSLYHSDQMSQRSLCSVLKTLIVSLVRASKQRTRSPIELLWTAKKRDDSIEWVHFQSPSRCFFNSMQRVATTIIMSRNITDCDCGVLFHYFIL